MNYTTNFNLNKPEGTDLYNHLTVDNPNMDTIDATMQANKLASVGAATELVSGTVHAITRSDSNQNIFKFKATGDFKAGDTITVDGVSVNAYTTGGQQLLDDAYVLSAQVLCILDGTSLWVLVNKTPEASEIAYDNNDNVKDIIDNNMMKSLTLTAGSHISNVNSVFARTDGKILVISGSAYVSTPLAANDVILDLGQSFLQRFSYVASIDNNVYGVKTDGTTLKSNVNIPVGNIFFSIAIAI